MSDRDDRLSTRTALASMLPAALLLGALACSLQSKAGTDTVRAAGVPAAAKGAFLSVSDIHFDPLYFTVVPGKPPPPGSKPCSHQGFYDLLTMDPAKWASSVFDVRGGSSLRDGLVGDTNYPLFESALRAMSPYAGKVDYILITGDFLAHSFPSSFNTEWSGIQGSTNASCQALAKKLGSDESKNYEIFVTKTLEFLAQELTAGFPGTPIYPTFGNNDSFCGDYNVNPNSAFVKAFSNTWGPSIDPNVKFSPGGSYVAPHPVVPGHSFVVVNDVYFSTSAYSSTSGQSKYPPPSWQSCTLTDGSAEMTWLKKQLSNTTDTVTLAFHIPPGLDNYGNAFGRHAASCSTKQATTTFQDPYASALSSLDWSKVAWVFAGHDHMDDFRIFTFDDGQGKKTTVPLHITPAISPKFGNNPGFQVFTYDTKTGGLKDYSTYYLDMGSPSAGWSLLYTFSGSLSGNPKPKGYGQPKYDLAGLGAVAKAILTDPCSGAAANYREFYDLGGTADFDWPVFRCTIENRTGTEFYSDCFCPPPLMPICPAS